MKNRFYGTLRNYLRCILSTLGPKPIHATIEISKLSPRWLNDFYNGTGGIAPSIQTSTSWDKRYRR